MKCLTEFYFTVFLFKVAFFKNVTEEDLIKSVILNGYKHTSRPNDTVTIKLNLQLKQIITVNDFSQIISTSSYLVAAWNDSRLIWDPRNYSNTSLITVPASNLWMPDLCVINSADTNGFITISNNDMAYILNSGQVALYISLNSKQIKFNKL